MVRGCGGIRGNKTALPIIGHVSFGSAFNCDESVEAYLVRSSISRNGFGPSFYLSCPSGGKWEEGGPEEVKRERETNITNGITTGTIVGRKQDQGSS